MENREHGKSLNESCPFGNRSTRYFSSVGKSPDLLESQEANIEIMRVLNELADEVKKRNPDWQPIPLSEYDRIAERSHSVSNHSLESLRDIFPIPEERTVDLIFQKNILPKNTILSRALAKEFLNPDNKQSSNKAKARHVLGLLQKNFSDFVESRGRELNLSKEPTHKEQVKQGDGIIVSQEDFELLINFQDMQERFESDDNIKKLNSHPLIKEVLEIILGIQLSICRTLEQLRKENPEWFDKNSIAFEEIAVIDENGNIIPSSRLLKLIFHNIGEYMVNIDENTTSENALFNALQEALRHNVFHQKVCIFQETESGMRFDGVVDKVCPVRSALSQMIVNQLTGRMLK